MANKGTVNYPAWHEEARAMRAKGMKVTHIADHFGMTANNMVKVTSPNWKSYLLLYRHGYDDRKGKGIADFNPEGYEFVPVEGPTPKEREDFNKKRKSNAPRKQEDDMARPRYFDTVKKFDQASKQTVQGFKITCSKCQKSEEHINNKGLLGGELLATIFTRRGWMVGKTPKMDICPECAKAFRSRPIEPKPAEGGAAFTTTPRKEETPMLQKMADAPLPVVNKEVTIRPSPALAEKLAAVPAAKPPQTDLPKVPVSDAEIGEMSRTDRRIIFSKLDDVYVDENTGYKSDWTDQKVADDLGVSVQWVREVRAVDFGPETNAEIRAKGMNDLIDMAKRIEQTVILIDKKIEIMEGLDDKLQKSLSETNAAVMRFEQLKVELMRSDDATKEVIDRFNIDVEQFNNNFSELRKLASS